MKLIILTLGFLAVSFTCFIAGFGAGGRMGSGRCNHDKTLMLYGIAKSLHYLDVNALDISLSSYIKELNELVKTKTGKDLDQEIAILNNKFILRTR